MYRISANHSIRVLLNVVLVLAALISVSNTAAQQPETQDSMERFRLAPIFVQEGRYDEAALAELERARKLAPDY